MSLTRLGKINDRWEMRLTHDRVDFHAARHGWEKERLATCAEMMTPGMTVYDVGAECGDFTAWYGMLVGQNGTVVPIEPSPPYWPAIRAHWKANNLPPLRAFFGGFASDVDNDLPTSRWTAEWSVPDAEGWPACSIGRVRPDFGFRHLAQQTADTPQITLDTLAERSGLPPHAIVFDIEGAELHGLRGSQRILAEHRPIVWLSVHPATMLEWYGHTHADINAFMLDLEYEGVKLGEDSEEYWLWLPRW